jgi:hypothetical protein
VSLVFVLVLVPIRLSCFMGEALVAADNCLSIIVIIMTSSHILWRNFEFE